MAGSTGTYELRLFDRNDNNKCIDKITNLKKGVSTIDFQYTASVFAYGGNEGQCSKITIQ